MPNLKLWSSVTLASCGWLSACSDQPASEPSTGGAGSSSTAGAPRAGDGFTSSGSGGRAAAGSVSSADGGNEPFAGSAGAGVGGEGLGGTEPDPGSGGEPNGDAGATASSNCPAQPTTLQLSCADVVERWSPSYVLDTNQWLFDASAAQHPIQGGSLTFFSTYSSSDFPICGVVSIEASGSQLLATLAMDSHYLTASQVAKFRLTDVCGNHYDYEPTGSACGSIVSSESNSWSAGCAKSCPGACN